MEIDFFVRCEFNSEIKRDKIFVLIDGETRPILDDDVEVEFQDSFNIIDDFPEPDEIGRKNDKAIDFVMSLGGYDFEDEVQIVLKGLKKIGVIRLLSIIWDGEDLVDFIEYKNGQEKRIHQYSQDAFELASKDEDFSSVFKLFDTITS